MIVTLALLASLAPAAPARAVSVVGKVEVRTGDTTMPLVRFAELTQGSVVVTHDSSYATLRLQSGSLVRLAPRTRIALSRLEPGEPAGRRKTEIKLAIGRVWARVLKLFGKDSAFEIATDNAVAGVRGTALWVSTDGRQDELVLDSGALRVRVDGKEILLDQERAFVRVTAAGADEPGRKSAAEIAALRRDVGQSSAMLLHRLARVDRWTRAGPPLPDRRSKRQRFKQTLVGPDGVIDSPARRQGPADRIRGRADLEIRLRLPR